MPTTAEGERLDAAAAEKMRVGDQAEEAAEAALAAAGWDVINLNRLAKNFRFADLLAKRGATRVLVQVKGTTTGEGKFGALPEPARTRTSPACPRRPP